MSESANSSGNIFFVRVENYVCHGNIVLFLSLEIVLKTKQNHKLISLSFITTTPQAQQEEQKSFNGIPILDRGSKKPRKRN